VGPGERVVGVGGDVSTPARRHRSWTSWALRGLSLVLLGLGIWLIVIPQWREAVEVIPRIQHLPVMPLAAAALAEAGSLLSFSGMTMLMIGAGMTFATALRIDLADLAVNHTMPGGGGVAAAARFRLFVRRGVPPADALAVASVETMVSNIVLGALFVVGVLLPRGSTALGGAAVWAGGIVGALLIGTVLFVWLVSQRSSWLLSLIGRLEEKVHGMRRARLGRLVDAAAHQLALLRAFPGRTAACAAFALGNWLLDALALWSVMMALGVSVPVGPLLAAYGAATILAQLPITPGGLGLVEGVLVPAFVAAGVPTAAALLGVLGWRVLEYWLPIPVGGLSLLSLRVSGRRTSLARPRRTPNEVNEPRR